MTGEWTGADGWPCDFAETPIGLALMAAIRGLPGGGEIAEGEAEALARRIFASASLGRDAELLPRNQPAGQKAAEADLKRLHDLADALARQIEAMHRPAIDALVAEGIDPFTWASRARELREAAHAARSEVEGEAARGRPPKVEAKEATRAAADVFEHVTRRSATVSTGPETGAVSGPWPAFLSAVNAALGIKASVAKQTRPISAENARRKRH